LAGQQQGWAGYFLPSLSKANRFETVKAKENVNHTCVPKYPLLLSP
jgi:hypothetical protein